MYFCTDILADVLWRFDGQRLRSHLCRLQLATGFWRTKLARIQIVTNLLQQLSQLLALLRIQAIQRIVIESLRLLP